MNPEFTVSPSLRPAVRKDFPDPVLARISNHSKTFPDYKAALEAFSKSGIADNIIATVKTELAKDGLTLETAPPISIAFPQRLVPIPKFSRPYLPLDVPEKTREEMGLINSGIAKENAKRAQDDKIEREARKETILLLQKQLEEKTGKKWPIADDIYQIDNRKRYMTGCADYGQARFASASALKPSDNRRYFVVFDDALVTGNAVVNLIGYIEQNGGRKVLAAAFEQGEPTKLIPDRDWIEKEHGATIAKAAEHGFNGGKPNFPTEKENMACRWAIACKTLGVDVRDILPLERGWQHPLGFPNTHPDHEALTADVAGLPVEERWKRVLYTERDAQQFLSETHELTQSQKALLKKHARTGPDKT